MDSLFRPIKRSQGKSNLMNTAYMKMIFRICVIFVQLLQKTELRKLFCQPFGPLLKILIERATSL